MKIVWPQNNQTSICAELLDNTLWTTVNTLATRTCRSISHVLT